MKYTAISALVVGLLTVARSQELRNDNQLTDLAVVQGSSLATPIALSAESFTDLITNGNIFIDKSLIIKRILDREIGHMKLLSRPPGWGKTMVLDMIRKFFAVEFDANGDHVLPDEQTHGYKLFELGEYKGKGPMRKLERPLLISKHKDIMRNHRGHYPVLYTSFSGFKPKNFEEYETGVALRFRDAFHKYNFNQMVETLRSIGRAPDNEALQRLRNVTELKEKFEWKDLRTMCDLLERYFKRKPLILIDDYDDPLVEALADHTIDQRRELVKAITKSYVWLFLELKEGDFYTHAMLTCITRVMYENYTQSGDVCGVQDPTFARFHGFHSNEIDMIFRHLNIPEDLRNKTHAYYGGYQLGRYDQKHYTPSSIAKFVATRKFQPYWKMREAVDKIFDKCVQNHFFRHLIHRPISGDAKYKIPLIDHDFDFDSVKFARFLDNPEMSFPYGWSDVCLGYGAGYLTNGVEYDPELSEPYFYEEIVPNEEVRKEIERKLKIYYANELGVSNRDFKEVEALTRKYERFLYSNLNNSIDMCEAFENFLHKLPALNPLSNAPFTIDHIERRTFHSKLAHSLLNFMLLFLPGFELLDSNYCDDQTDARAFLTMSRGTFGVVQRFTFGYDSPDYAFRLTNKLPSRLAPFSFPHLQLVRRVGINYGPMTKVEIIALTSNITGEYEKIVKKDEDKDESVHVLRTIMESDSAQTEDYGTVIYNATDSEGMIWNHTMRYWMGNTFDFSKEMDECYHSNESVSL